MSFEGHLHSGLDDSRNIARIAMRLAEDGCELKVNEYINYDKNEHKGNARKVSKDSPMGRDSEEELDQSLSSLVLSNGTSDKETEDVDDLLEYYRLQKT